MHKDIGDHLGKIFTHVTEIGEKKKINQIVISHSLDL